MAARGWFCDWPLHGVGADTGVVGLRAGMGYGAYMDIRTLKLVFLLIAGGLYWQFVCQNSEVAEPWDTEAYWPLWYPISLALSAIAGFFLKNDGWLAGAIITLMQLPIMWFNSGVGPLILVGLFFLSVLAVPAVAISLLAGRLGARFSS